MFLRVPEGCPSLQLTAISEYSNNQYPCSWEWNDQDISFPTLSLGLKSGWTSIINASLESLKQTILQLYTYYPQSIHQAKQPQQTSMKINVKSSTGTPNQLSLHSSPIISHCFWQSEPTLRLFQLWCCLPNRVHGTLFTCRARGGKEWLGTFTWLSHRVPSMFCSSEMMSKTQTTMGYQGIP